MAEILTSPELPTTVRPFPLKTLSKQLDDRLAQLPPDAKGAVIAAADMDGARMVVAAKVGEHWSFAGELKHDWKGSRPLEGSVEVRFAW